MNDATMQRGFRAETAAEALELVIYGPLGIGEGPGVVCAESVVRAIQEFKGGQIDVFINSPGGIVYDGLAINSALRRNPAHKRVFIDGICASAATIIAMAGDEVIAAESAMIMVHAAWNSVTGGAGDLRREAGLLDSLTDTMIRLYKERTKRPHEQVAQWVAEETWFTAAEAQGLGLVDEVTAASRAVASYDYAAFGLPIPRRAMRPATLEGLRLEVAELRSELARLKAGDGPQAAAMNAALRETFSEWLEEFKDAAIEALSDPDDMAAAFRADYGERRAEARATADGQTGDDAPLGELLARVKGGLR